MLKCTYHISLRMYSKSCVAISDVPTKGNFGLVLLSICSPYLLSNLCDILLFQGSKGGVESNC